MKRHEWAEHIEDWKRSGLDAADYGKRHGIAPKKLYWWSWFLRARSQRTTAATGPKLPLLPRRPAELLRVRLRALPSGRQSGMNTNSVEEVLPNGAVIRAAATVDPVWLGRLVVAGTSAC
jgi:hypothetical protein